MQIAFEGDSLAAIIGQMRAFLATIERPARGDELSSSGSWTGSALPACPRHMIEMEFRPAGRNRRGPYSASYRCPRPDCREASWIQR